MVKTLFTLVMIFTTPKAFALGTAGTSITPHTVRVAVYRADGTQIFYDMSEMMKPPQGTSIHGNKTVITDPYGDLIVKVATIDRQRAAQVKMVPAGSVRNTVVNKPGSKAKIIITDTDNGETRIIAYGLNGNNWKRQYESVTYKAKDLGVKAKAHAKLTPEKFEKLFSAPISSAKKVIGSYQEHHSVVNSNDQYSGLK